MELYHGGSPLVDSLHNHIFTDWLWQGPSQPLQQMALAVMGLGQILPIRPPAPNATWTLDLWAPALQCNDVEANKRDSIWTNIWNSYNNNTGLYGSLAWVPWSPNDVNMRVANMTAGVIDRDLPFLHNASQVPSWVGPPPAALSTDGYASLFFAVLPGAQNFTIVNPRSGLEVYPNTGPYQGSSCVYQNINNLSDPLTGCDIADLNFTPSLLYQDSTLLRCDLINTSMSLKFHFLNGEQNIQIKSNTTGTSPIIDASSTFLGPSPDTWSNTSAPANCSSFLDSDYDGNFYKTPCLFDMSTLRLLSYQGIMAAFNQLALGSIQSHLNNVVVNTTIMKTVLAKTEELSFIRNWNSMVGSDLKTPRIPFSTSDQWASPGLYNPKLPDVGGDLKTTLEQLFQNFTISLLSEPYFQ